MPQDSKNKFTLKIISGYLILGILVVLAGRFIYSEFQTYSDTQQQSDSEKKLLSTNALLAALYEAENQSKLALQNGKRANFLAYSKKVDSIYHSIEALKQMVKSDGQVHKLDSVQQLLQQKVYNNAELRKLREKDKNSAPLDSLLGAFHQMEADMGRITAESMVPNFDKLSEATQQSLREYVAILNRNIPKDNSEHSTQKQMDSILDLSKSIVQDAKMERSKMEQSMLGKELQIHRTDLELSQKLRSIISTFEQELLLDTYSNNYRKQQLLKRSSNLAWIAAILGFAVIVLFTFLTANDYWKGQLLRMQLEKEKHYSESLLRSREQLISTVSHDLRTPLNTIKGYAELLESHIAAPTNRQYIRNLKSSLGYVENLVNDLLDFSKLEAGKLRIHQEPFLLHTLLEEIINDLEGRAKNQSVVLSLMVEEALQKPILGDAFRVKQIVTNLVENALKFTSIGSVAVKVFSMKDASGSRLEIQVTDSGIGIEEDMQELIFQEFKQVDTQPKKHVGHGLGLTISRKLAQLLGGTLTVNSKVNIGSTFSLNLPLKYASKAFESNVASPKPNNMGLAVLDDDQTLLVLIQEVCKIHGIKCSTFSSFDAFAKATDLDYGVLLSDIEMPQADGFKVLTNLKEGNVLHYRNQPILAMTGRRETPKSMYLEHGFAEVLLKPFSSKSLVSLLGKYLSPTIVPPTQVQEESRNFGSFNIELVASFVQDKSGLNDLLITFLNNTRQSLSQLENSANSGDTVKMEAIAHKMLPMFRQLKIHSMLPKLEALEHIGEDVSKETVLRNISQLKHSFQEVEKDVEGFLATPSTGIG